nr:hypothetical protein [Tanacetum cinerariifolium]
MIYDLTYINDDNDDDTDDEDKEDHDDDEEEEEEHLALADSSGVPIMDPVPPAGDTETFETNESAPTPIPPQTISHFLRDVFVRHARLSDLSHLCQHPWSPTNAKGTLGYRAAEIRMRALLTSTSCRTNILEADMPPRKRACVTTLALGFETGYEITDTWDEIIDTLMEIAPTILEGDDRALLRARVNTLFKDRPDNRHTTMLLDRETMYAHEAWPDYKDKSTAIEAHVRTLEAQVATLIAHTSSLQTQLTTSLGRIEILETRDLEPQEGPAEAGSSRSDDDVTTSFQRSQNSRPPMLDHQDKYIMKAQEGESVDSASSGAITLVIRAMTVGAEGSTLGEGPESKYQRTIWTTCSHQKKKMEHWKLWIPKIYWVPFCGLLSRTMGFLRGNLAVVVILVKGYAFSTIVKVLPVGCDPLALVGKVTHVEDSIGLLETTFDEDDVLMGLFPNELTGYCKVFSSGNSATKQWNSLTLTVAKCTSSEIIITSSGNALEYFIPNNGFFLSVLK